ncbi:helix-hairpin-helix domain-containing protein [Bacillus sp. NPDC093026]|uniref:helix-hairpin-helix domain-containing protein n=1 Tax=Bacillus sp. NPDC093026 TaxID=3363948 RepID=UPI0037F844D1
MRLIQFKKYSLYIIACFIITICIGLFLLLRQGENKTEPSIVKENKELQVQAETKQEETVNESTTIVVEVKGAVQKPGVYTFQSEDRIEEAIRRAGGFTRKADTIEINQAAKLEDSMMIYVPKQGESVGQPPVATAVTPSGDQKSQSVNVNQADATELQTVNGIGPAKAEAIIAYREEHGEFQQIDDLRKISGFGEKTVERLKDQLTVK